MPAGIYNFLSSFKTDLARPSRFDVMIPVPLVLSPFYLSTTKQFNLRCESAELPGRNLSTTERKIGSAPTQKYPYQSTYNDMQMVFLVSGNMKEKLFFDQWMELINPSSTFNFKYRADYVTDVVINQYDMQNNVTYKAVLVDSFPLAINQMGVNWNNNDYHRLIVTFTYTRFYEATVTDMAQNLGVQGIASLLGI